MSRIEEEMRGANKWQHAMFGLLYTTIFALIAWCINHKAMLVILCVGEGISIVIMLCRFKPLDPRIEHDDWKRSTLVFTGVLVIATALVGYQLFTVGYVIDDVPLVFLKWR